MIYIFSQRYPLSDRIYALTLCIGQVFRCFYSGLGDGLCRRFLFSKIMTVPTTPIGIIIIANRDQLTPVPVFSFDTGGITAAVSFTEFPPKPKTAPPANREIGIVPDMVFSFSEMTMLSHIRHLSLR